MTPPWDLRKRVDEADFGDAESVSVKDLRIGLSEIINRVACGGGQRGRYGRELHAAGRGHRQIQALVRGSTPTRITRRVPGKRRAGAEARSATGS